MYWRENYPTLETKLHFYRATKEEAILFAIFVERENVVSVVEVACRRPGQQVC